LVETILEAAESLRKTSWRRSDDRPTLVIGIVALGRGERSWLTLAGFAAALIVGVFWILFALDEVSSPH
jgi:hypothetical protein